MRRTKPRKTNPNPVILGGSNRRRRLSGPPHLCERKNSPVTAPVTGEPIPSGHQGTDPEGTSDSPSEGQSVAIRRDRTRWIWGDSIHIHPHDPLNSSLCAAAAFAVSALSPVGPAANPLVHQDTDAPSRVQSHALEIEADRGDKRPAERSREKQTFTRIQGFPSLRIDFGTRPNPSVFRLNRPLLDWLFKLTSLAGCNRFARRADIMLNRQVQSNANETIQIQPRADR